MASTENDIHVAFGKVLLLFQRLWASIPSQLSRLSTSSEAARIAYCDTLITLMYQLKEFERFCQSEPAIHSATNTLSTNIAKAEIAAHISDLLADEDDSQPVVERKHSTSLPEVEVSEEYRNQRALIAWLTSVDRPRIPRGSYVYFRDGTFHHWSHSFEHFPDMFTFRYGAPTQPLVIFE
jgi:hypothetical protein